jgi:putative ABC transport system permease protein
MGRFFGASASLRKSFADVTRRKGRTLLVVLGIFIGVVGLTAINTAEDALFAAITFSQSSQATQPNIILDVDHLDPALLPTLQSVAGVETVQYQTVFNTQWHVSQAPGHIPLGIVSYPDLHHVPLTPFQLTSGRYPNVGEIVMEYGDLGLQPFAIGDTVTVDTPQGTAQLRVVGLVRTPGHNPAASGNGEGYMSGAGLQQLTAGVGLSPEIAVKAQNQRHAGTVATALQQVLLAHGIAVKGNTISTGGPTSSPTSAIAGIFALLRILAIVAVVLSGFLILNTVTTLVAEQTAIIGAMKAAGGTRGAIMRGYLVSVGIYSLLATLPAIVLGVLGGNVLGSYLAGSVPIDIGPFVLQWWIVEVGLAVGFGVPILAALLPLWSGTRISVRDALAAYGVSFGGDYGPMARLSQHLMWIPQTVWLGLRGVFRKRWRAALTLLTLTLAGASFLVVQTASASVAHAVASVNANLAADIEVDTAQPTSLAQLRSQLSMVGNIRRVERYGRGTDVMTRWGRMAMLAFDSDTQLYHYQLTSGHWLASGETGTAVLSDEALARTGLHLGDTLTVSDQGSQSAQVTLRIVGTVKQSISDIGAVGAIVTSLPAYIQVGGFPVSAGSPGDASLTFLIQARDRSPSAVNQLTDELDGLLNQGQNQGQAEHCTQVCGGGSAAVTLISAETQHKQQSWFVLYALLYAVALIVGAVGVLGLANALTASVLERRREIGMLRAMGATGWRVGQVFWSEGLALGGIAWLVGGIIGLPLAYLFVRAFGQWVMPVDFVIDPAAFVVMFIAVVVIASLATLASASRAAQIRVADMLRYE